MKDNILHVYYLKHKFSELNYTYNIPNLLCKSLILTPKAMIILTKKKVNKFKKKSSQRTDLQFDFS